MSERKELEKEKVKRLPGVDWRDELEGSVRGFYLVLKDSRSVGLRAGAIAARKGEFHGESSSGGGVKSRQDRAVVLSVDIISTTMQVHVALQTRTCTSRDHVLVLHPG
jgi:hypothetical protein